MRADRLLSALLVLQAHGKQTGRELAARLEVSQRTVHRDMEALSAAGVPVFAIRGVRGGWQLDDEWRTQVPGLDDAELRALLMAQPRIVGDTRLAAAAERALDKLVAALPSTLRQRAAAMRQRLFVDTTGWYRRVENLWALPLVQESLSRDRKLLINYRKPNRERAERAVDPLGLVAKGASWYLVANTPNGYRTFRVSRIEHAKVLEAACERPPDFDLAAYWKASTTAFMESRRRLSVTVRMDPNAAESLEQWCPEAVVIGPSSPADPWVTVRLAFDDEDQAAFMVLGFGPRIDVVAPASLRRRVDEDIASAVSRRALRA
ncbi:MAG TPA: WYL domain-containing protein [Vicinamibacterales bacterium]|nr:WYL domain-containing protein [Vicinamibacterales bacterium]